MSTDHLPLNRHQRRAEIARQRKHIAQYPKRLTRLPRTEWPESDPVPSQVWVSQQFLVQLVHEPNAWRISVNRTALGRDGRWADGITWDELQAIKREIGFGDNYAVEVYPRDIDAVNVANMRHLWVPMGEGPVGWRRGES